MIGLPPFDEESYSEANGFDIDSEPKPTGEHTISNVNPSASNAHSRMLCSIDAVAGMCMYALLTIICIHKCAYKSIRICLYI
jgi:hypothetical protein